MSKIHYDPISLEELIQLSDAIVVAKPRDPFRTTVEMPLLKKRDAPPFVKVNLHFDVVESFKGDASGEIVVSQAELESAMHVHRLHHEELISRHWIARAYGGGEVKRSAKRVLFLQRYEDQWVYAAEGSEEPLSKLQRIRDLLGPGE